MLLCATALVPLLLIKGRALALYKVYFLFVSFPHDYGFCLYLHVCYPPPDGRNGPLFAISFSHILTVVTLDLCMLFCIVVIDVQSSWRTLSM